MALINCPRCNKEIASEVIACPHCEFGVKMHFDNIKYKKESQEKYL